MAGRKNKTKNTRCGKTWTEARYWSFIRSALRRAWVKYPVRYQALQAARRPYTGKDKRTKWEYRCNLCNSWFKTKDVEVDHIEECGSLKNYRDLMGFCKRLFCELDNLQVVCKPCHKAKGKK
jgi:5-methylcytosine-specific restriction endonuclease McrA